MKIGIVNAGNIGLNLGVAWIRYGYDIMLSKDTHPERLRERVRAIALNRGLTDIELSRFKYGSIVEAALFGEIVILSAYFPRMDHVLRELHDNSVTLSRKIVIDTMNPLNVDVKFNHYHDLEYMERTSITEELQKEFPEALLFKAFNNIPATLLDARKWAEGHAPSIIFVGGNSTESANEVRSLIKAAGFQPQFAGCDLADSRILERLGVLMHHIVDNEYRGEFSIAFNIIRSKGK